MKSNFELYADNFLEIEKLPSIESMFIKWMELADQALIYPNAYLKYGQIEIYVRKSKRRLYDNEYIMLDVARMNVYQSYYTEWFKIFKKLIDALNPWEGVYYENIDNEEIVDYLKLKGYKQYGSSSFYSIRKQAAIHIY
jgi:hypothetical protein